MQTFDISDLKFLVPISRKHQETSWKITDMLDGVALRDYMILYNLYHSVDGHWRTSPSSTAVAVIFRNEEDAVGFRLKL